MSFRKNFLLRVLVLLIIACAIPVHANNLYIREMTEANRFNDRTVYKILKDSTGFVWFATGKGIERYDGIHVRHYPIGSKSAGLVSDIIQVPQSGEIFAGNKEGLWRLSESGLSFDLLKELNLSQISSMAVAGSGRLVVGTTSGLYRVDTRKKTSDKIALASTSSLGTPAVNDLCYDDRSSTIWLATTNGLQSVSMEYPSKAKAYEFGSPARKQSFNRIIKIGDNIYLGTLSRGIIKFNIPTETFSDYTDIGCNVISAFETDGNGKLYVGSDGGGVSVIDTQTDKVIQHYRREDRKANALHSNSVYSLELGKEGRIWVGYYQAGVDYSTNNNGIFSVFDDEYYSTFRTTARSVLRDGERIILGTLEGVGIIDLLNKKSVTFRRPILRSDMILSLVNYKDRYYVGTYGGGLSVIDKNGNVSEFPVADDQFMYGSIFALSHDGSGNLWIGTSNGVYKYDGSRIVSHFTSSNSRLPEGNVYEIFFDSSGKAWIATENGLAIYDNHNNTIRTDLFPKGFFNKLNIRQIFEDRKHRLYFLPYKGDLYSSDREMKTFGKVSSRLLEQRDVKAMTEDKFGNLWIATSEGMVRWNGRDSWKEFGTADGIPSKDFNSCRPAIDEDGNIWFGNSMGLIMLNGKQASTDPVSSNVRLNDISVNGMEYQGKVRHEDNAAVIDFHRHYGNVTLSFSDFSYSDPDNNHYEYKMDGVDDEWHEFGTDFSATYYSLPSGTHTIHVRSRGSLEDALTVKIKNPLEWWAWVLWVILAVVVTVCIFIVLRKHRRKLYPVEQEEMEEGEEEFAETASDSDENENNKYKMFRLSDRECRQLERNLKEIVSEKRPFVKPDLRIDDLAEMIGVSRFRLSFYFSQYKHITYYEYINTLRVEEFKRLVELYGPDKYTLSAFSEKAGFSSRSTFFRYFKKVEGISPAEYLRRNSAERSK